MTPYFLFRFLSVRAKTPELTPTLQSARASPVKLSYEGALSGFSLSDPANTPEKGH